MVDKCRHSRGIKTAPDQHQDGFEISSTHPPKKSPTTPRPTSTRHLTSDQPDGPNRPSPGHLWPSPEPSPEPSQPAPGTRHTPCRRTDRAGVDVRVGPRSPSPAGTTPAGGPGAPATGPAPASGLARPDSRLTSGKSVLRRPGGRGVHKSPGEGEGERYHRLLPTFRQPQLSSWLSSATSVHRLISGHWWGPGHRP